MTFSLYFYIVHVVYDQQRICTFVTFLHLLSGLTDHTHNLLLAGFNTRKHQNHAPTRVYIFQWYLYEHGDLRKRRTHTDTQIDHTSKIATTCRIFRTTHTDKQTDHKFKLKPAALSERFHLIYNTII